MVGKLVSCSSGLDSFKYTEYNFTLIGIINTVVRVNTQIINHVKNNLISPKLYEDNNPVSVTMIKNNNVTTNKSFYLW